jgi:hypothetical protein
MDFGVVMFPTEYAIQPDELARALEERGFESLWVPEHTHIPASRRSPFPGGGPLPRDYWSAYDPFVALMAAAGVARAIFGLPSESREAVLPRLDAYSAVIRSMRERRISLARGVWRRVGGPRPAGSRFLFRGRGVGCLVG